MPANTPRGYTYPLYGDVANFPAQIMDFANDVDADVQSLVNQINAANAAPSARVSATANQAVAANTDVFATFATEDYDNAAMGNLGVNNDRLTFTSSGIYLVQGSVIFASNGNATVNGRQIGLNIGALNLALDNRAGNQTQDTRMTASLLYMATAAQFVRIHVRQSSGASVNITTRSLTATKMVI